MGAGVTLDTGSRRRVRQVHSQGLEVSDTAVAMQGALVEGDRGCEADPLP